MLRAKTTSELYDTVDWLHSGGGLGRDGGIGHTMKFEASKGQFR
jgi:hypothetical protein